MPLGSPMEPQPDRASDHPFDTPFSIMQTMQAELVKLREELVREQQERKAEVTNLKKELRDLTESVRKDAQKQQGDHDRLAQSLKELQVKEEHDWKTTRRDMEVELSKRCTVSQHEALIARLDSNAKGSRETHDLIHKSLEELERRIGVNEVSANAFAQHVNAELAASRKQIDINTANDNRFSSSVIAQLTAAGQQLQHAGQLNRTAGTAARVVAAGGTSSPGPYAAGKASMRA